jgi:hypothetical protein
MSDTPNSSKPKRSKIAFAVIWMPDGTEHEIPLPPKAFSFGREGCTMHKFLGSYKMTR